MIIATIKEIKNNENRVGLTPFGVKKLIEAGHKVIVQKSAGENAGFPDLEYEESGAQIVGSAIEAVKSCDILVKVKEPLESEYELLDNFKGKILYTYLHLAGVPRSLTEKLLENKITAIAYETVVSKKELPLLKPMSQVAGVLAVQYGAEYLQKKYGGRGVTLGIIENAPIANVVVVGGGVVGSTAARTAAGMGARVKILEISDEKISELKERFSIYDNLEVLKSEKDSLFSAVSEADLLIGAVLVAGARAPIVVTEEIVKNMKKGAVIVDVAIDQGGCVFGSRATSHDNPIYKNENGVIYCCIPNMPGQVALQSTQALTNSTLPYLLKLADKGIEALREDEGFAKGLNTYDGRITNELVARDLGMMDKYQSFS